MLATLESAMHGDTLRLQANGRSINVSVRLDGERVGSTLFGEKLQLVDQGREAGVWLSGLLSGGDISASLLPLLGLPAYRLLTSPRGGSGRRGGLKDASPIHLLCESSLLALNARRAASGLQPVGIDRFRPNLLVSGCAAPHAEDAWESVTIGAATFRVDSPCPRCTVPDVQQATGRRDAAAVGPMATLRGYRRQRGGTMFGVYLTPTSVGASVSVGDAVLASGRAAVGPWAV